MVEDTDQFGKGIKLLREGIANALIQLRQEAGLSQKDLAEMVDYNQSAVSRVENCKHDSLDLVLVYKLFKCMGVDIEMNFLYDEDEDDMFANE
jgi:transcriptional regulator with XRE-family HTH domain